MVKTTAPLFLETVFSTSVGSLTDIQMSSNDGRGNIVLNFNDAATQDAIHAVSSPQAVTLYHL